MWDKVLVEGEVYTVYFSSAPDGGMEATFDCWVGKVAKFAHENGTDYFVHERWIQMAYQSRV